MEVKYIMIALLGLGLIAVWWFLFFKKEQPVKGKFSKTWKEWLLQKVSFYKQLSAEEQLRFEQAILQFLHDVRITGISTSVDDFDRLLVASSAVIPLFGFPGWRYRNLNEVLLYEGTFNHDFETEGKDRNIIGMVGSGAMNRVMILSKPALHQGFENQLSRSNVGIHEFVHLLDKADGTTDGIPKVLLQQQFVIPWLKMIHREIENIKDDQSDINPYGASNEAEFFSVVSEYFFKQPQKFKHIHPDLFALLEKIYHQNMDDHWEKE